ncbi:MAG: hypothetical protein QM790_08820 [Nibricoccus sp.]
MFKRFIYEDWAMIFPVAAFITAACIFIYFVSRAMRMKRSQVERFSSLPFNEENSSRHESRP